MVKLAKIISTIILIILIGFIGKYIYENKYIKIQNGYSNENLKNDENNNKKSEEITDEKENIKEKEKEKENYINIDKSLVRIPILMYHSISDSDPNNSLLVPVKQFEEEVKWLKENGFTPMLLDDVVKAYESGDVPKKPVAITFDDGYADNYSEAYRILKENNMKGTFFIITNNTDIDSYYMNSSMLKEMNHNGMGIENHTSRHIEFSNICREDKIAIIEEGRKALKEKVGVDSNFICYPVGKYDEETIEVEKELGIKAAVTTEYGISSISDGLHSLKRIRIFPMNIDSFKETFIEFM
ncbi:MAG: polysaccharide deacetylase family protein [Clostridium sp.]|uniref:polysaccharide deacetylase family protein n=1 Tax=Clostridium sp. TaxID=1506 RepID=UPI0025BC9ED3|nr:polysaccharide deacetylase family protein [Clostridium sp.]MCF0149159.1 polysaccharide deacetylase family protein [Clostridium sp.]